MNKLLERLIDTSDKWFPFVWAVGAVISIAGIIFVIRILLHVIDFLQKGGTISISFASL
ncbi:hypothetical protein Barb6_02483 [Bacteroidales bacterium Barb6]|nr:hypothetical protein Barb6_02483 [Bacteroidales bacterium Barb6]